MTSNINESRFKEKKYRDNWLSISASLVDQWGLDLSVVELSRFRTITKYSASGKMKTKRKQKFASIVSATVTTPGRFAIDAVEHVNGKIKVKEGDKRNRLALCNKVQSLSTKGVDLSDFTNLIQDTFSRVKRTAV